MAVFCNGLYGGVLCCMAVGTFIVWPADPLCCVVLRLYGSDGWRAPLCCTVLVVMYSLPATLYTYINAEEFKELSDSN